MNIEDQVVPVDVTAELLHTSDGTTLYAVRSALERTVCSPTSALLICPPFLEEHHWAYRVLYRLAHSLAVEGFPTWRFDFSGAGNSGGECKDLRTWQTETRYLLDEIARRENNSATLGVIGLRLGAYLAFQAAASDPRVRTVVLLEPVLNPWRYMQQCLHLNSVRESVPSKPMGLKFNPPAPKNPPGETFVDLLGYALEPRFIDSFRAEGACDAVPHKELEVLMLDLAPSRRAIRLESESWFRTLQAHAARAERRDVTVPHFWNRLGVFDAPELNREIVDWVKGVFLWKK